MSRESKKTEENAHLGNGKHVADHADEEVVVAVVLAEVALEQLQRAESIKG